MNTQEICGILENINPEILGFGKKSENTDFLADIGYVEIFLSDDNFHWFATLTNKGMRFLNQNKPGAAKINGPFLKTEVMFPVL